MRLPEVERGDSLRSRTLIGIISVALGVRLPDAARVAFYHKDFVGSTLGAWTQRAMRGPSEWSVAERELMAAVVAKWNSCPFCVGAHRAIAVRGMDSAVAVAALFDIITRYANALDLAVPTDAEFGKAAGMMLKRGYA